MVKSLKKSLLKLQKKLSSAAGQLGGGFEWVDSVLVRSLREGQWLLIDNVNFCRYDPCAVESFILPSVKLSFH